MKSKSALNSDALKYVYTSMSKYRQTKSAVFFHIQINNLFDLELPENMEPLLSSMHFLDFGTTSFKRVLWSSITDYGGVLELIYLETLHIGLPLDMLSRQNNIL